MEFKWRVYFKYKNSSATPLYHFKAHDSYILKCVVSPNTKYFYYYNNRYLATTSADSTIKIWNIDDHCTLNKTLQGHQV